MKQRICYLCGKPATGFASVWTREHGERWYCHGDDDAEPTCYERAPHYPVPMDRDKAVALAHDIMDRDRELLLRLAD